MESFYQNINIGRWQQLSLSKQLANIGSEFMRTYARKEAGDEESRKKAFERMIHLMDLTIGDTRWKHRSHELLRLREVISDFFFANKYNTNAEQFKKYFLFFALNI